jgi:L-seryl-tRNA(Ser) seleniumtransferase
MPSENLHRLIPSVDKVLKEVWIQEYLEYFGREYTKALLINLLNNLREEITAGEIDKAGLNRKLSNLSTVFKKILAEDSEYYLKRLINCTGVVIHTNLGRSPLPTSLFRRTIILGTRYSNLEFDLSTGKRSSRNLILDSIIEKIFPGYSSVVVNNNAAAVMLVLNTFAEGKNVVISRGELVEIGGSFRIPEVMSKSGGILKEVGTTNKTRISDYRDGIDEETAMIMTVHPSNYRITGFTESVPPWDLLSLAEKNNLPLYHDMGSGNMFPEEEIALPDEPNVEMLIKKGIHIISFSGDKLLGGVQAGIILALPRYIERIRSNQLLRTLRVCKLTYICVEELFRSFLTERYKSELPIYRMLSVTEEDIRKRAESLKEEINNPKMLLTLMEGKSRVGGGAAPEYSIATFLIALQHSELNSNRLQAVLRKYDPPIITRIEDDRVVIDLRTVFPDETEIIIEALNSI